ncbi:M23 family metallopeptidase [Noviherbaspirillum suwonense]|jgi:murein DD-endopeptidase MepM/ murein hydrolase activator NlpD|uniref:Peptidase family M23 n=1 Tax=Noviherbaspirillum suwonense TaxID=1224511 RepID=A0ABY1PWL9_9BURK|nr:M23 family metallopeptidase [Noviherbaspirillum suwonense]RZL91778.1 MAG: M23 family metallopeptidase [Variovorax sp.]SMP51457.1 Peptidase family M23 [Noviherbaspirillum suwonense]
MSVFFRILRPLFWAAVLLLAAALAEAPLRLALYSAELAAMPAPQYLAMPVEGVRPASLRDTWHAPRDGGGRRHEGLDIFAPRGRPVRSATEGLVMRVGTNRLGGQVVWVMGPGGQRHYYAHLDRFAGVRAGERVAAGTVLGYVGTTGNARGTPPHLHYGIYTARGAISPYPLLTRDAPATVGAEG